MSHTPNSLFVADHMKFTGLVVAFIGIGTVYILPRAIPSYRSIIGMPGV